jgi:RecJ-like exonuclease
VGYFQEVAQCSACNGSGTFTNKEGKISKCYTCGGSGKVTQKRNCDTCSGRGVLAYPKSPKPPVAKEEVWTGWKVRVETNPPGAKVSVVDVNTAKYKDAGASNIEVRWFSSSQSYPIIVEYQGKQVKVLPFTLDGKASRKVVIDFLSASQPVVQVGRKVE